MVGRGVGVERVSAVVGRGAGEERVSTVVRISSQGEAKASRTAAQSG